MTRAILIAAALLLAACGADGEKPGGENAKAGAQDSAAQQTGYNTAEDPLFKARSIRAHIGFLASDELEGREAGTRGYDIAAEYVASQFAQAGLKPGAGDGYMQTVALRRYTSDVEAAGFTILREGADETLDARVEFLPGDDPNEPETMVEAPVVFAGYGAVTEQRNDYAGIDAEGKIVAVIGAAPPGVESSLAAHLASSTTKAETAVDQGAAGMIVLMAPETQRRFSFETLARFAGRGSITWIGPDGTAHEAAPGLGGQAVLSEAGAARLFDGAARSYEDIMAASEAGGEDIAGFDLPVSVRMSAVTEHSDLVSENVIGVVEGSDPALRGEYVVLTAHLDHIGVSERVDGGDKINNGAMDNASGTAAMLEVARVAASEGAPRRSLMFIALTAEEKGLVGAEYYVNNPTVPKEAIVANINLDMPVLLYEFTDVIAFGADHSTLGRAAQTALAEIDVKLTPDPLPDQNLFTRSDHYRFVQQGIPSLFLMTGFEGEGESEFRGFLATNYHRPGDDLSQPLNYLAGAKFARANYEIMTEVANADERPVWNAGDYFGERYGGPMADAADETGNASGANEAAN